MTCWDAARQDGLRVPLSTLIRLQSLGIIPQMFTASWAVADKTGDSTPRSLLWDLGKNISRTSREVRFSRVRSRQCQHRDCKEYPSQEMTPIPFECALAPLNRWDISTEKGAVQGVLWRAAPTRGVGSSSRT